MVMGISSAQLAFTYVYNLCTHEVYMAGIKLVYSMDQAPAQLQVESSIQMESSCNRITHRSSHLTL